MDILLLEDDLILSELIEEFLLQKGHRVWVAYDGLEALELIEGQQFDLLLLDVGVPNLNGFELLEYLKATNITTPAIYITSLSSANDIERAFSIGCDDYIKKPFDLKELEVRLNYLAKVLKLERNEFRFKNGYLYNFDLKKIINNQEQFDITLKEAQILEYFIKHPNRLISLDELSSNIWSSNEAPTYSTIRTYIKNIRKILGKDILTTLKGAGYKFEV